MWKRTFSTHGSIPLLKQYKRTSFDKYLNIEKPKKAWNNDFTDTKFEKEKYFKSKFAHIHSRQKLKPKEDKYGKKIAHVNKLKQIKQDQKLNRKEHLQSFTKTLSRKDSWGKLQANPLLEYIYGTNSVIAALNNERRKDTLNKIYYYGQDTHQFIIEKLKSLGLNDRKMIPLQESNKQELNQLSRFNLHNNIILETKPLDIVEINHLGAIQDTESAQFSINVTNDFAIFADDIKNDITQNVPFTIKQNQGKSFPVGLFLDEIVDPHNIGAIIRSAYFLGVDFIVMTKRNSPSLTPVVSKASSGSMEFLPIFHVDDPLRFFQKSQLEENGNWTFITSHCTSGTDNEPVTQFVRDKTLDIHDLNGMAQQTPLMLVMGNEGKGVRSSLRQVSDYFVEIPYNGPQHDIQTVDSLNVSVASAILINHLLPCP
ncbi:hypothetical protein C6P45_000975 [Maudiozyma exigua]|uniref:rRNA methyltransferase 1, mitochondrial n=1 Tax=Maudiozyma exigua TaxID=34358 RepID=A0A9P6WFK4_MAUEX|nr:hypothetical protein C6P45_000975 [Kazachstania exigua]